MSPRYQSNLYGEILPLQSGIWLRQQYSSSSSLLLLSHSYPLFFVVHISVKPCRYDNQTFGINQSIITSNCEERCGCNFRNGTTMATCKPLCKTEEDLKCDQHSQVIEEYQRPFNGTSCVCPRKKCVAGLILLLVEIP